MDKKQRLLKRLDDIGGSLERSGHALALVGLGSTGLELERLDEYSDLDFFVIVEAGQKGAYLENLDWLSAVCPIAYHFRNTDDGYKLLFEDGIFCEMAVFEPPELEAILFAPGRVVWKQSHVDASIAALKRRAVPDPKPAEWLLGEALTNLYVGLSRYRRGEKLSAARFIQQYALDRVLELVALGSGEELGHEDAFAPERRFELRFPETARMLPGFLQGYERSPDSALAILGFLEQRFDVNPALVRAIRELWLAPDPDGRQ
jgi:hypothetical protein